MVQEYDFIETPENVELQRKLAGIGSRFFAGLIDAMVFALLSVMVAVVVLILVTLVIGTAFDDLELGYYTALGLLSAAMFLLSWGYFVALELWTNGQSVGKRAMRLRVVRADGGTIGFVESAIRNFLRAFDWLGLYLVGGVVMFLTGKSQRLGDLAAGTVVISEAEIDYGATAGRPLPARWLYDVTPEALRATGLGPEPYRALWSYWVRRGELDLAARELLLTHLVRPILVDAGEMSPNEAMVAAEDHVELLLRRGLAAERDSLAADSRRQALGVTRAELEAEPSFAPARRSGAAGPPEPAPGSDDEATAEPPACSQAPPAPTATAPFSTRLDGLTAEERAEVEGYRHRREKLSPSERAEGARRIAPILKRRGLLRPTATAADVDAWLGEGPADPDEGSGE